MRPHKNLDVLMSVSERVLKMKVLKMHLRVTRTDKIVVTIGCLILLLFAGIGVVNYLLGYRFGNVYFRNIDCNVQVITDARGRVLVGPGCMTISGRYPYLVGDVVANRKCSSFYVDVRDGSVRHEAVEVGAVDSSKYLTYESLGSLDFVKRTEQFFRDMKEPKGR